MGAARIVLAALLSFGCRGDATTRPASASEAASARFHELLAHYGSWIDTREHGRVWVPGAGDRRAGFLSVHVRGDMALHPDALFTPVDESRTRSR